MRGYSAGLVGMIIVMPLAAESGKHRAATRTATDAARWLWGDIIACVTLVALAQAQPSGKAAP